MKATVLKLLTAAGRRRLRLLSRDAGRVDTLVKVGDRDKRAARLRHGGGDSRQHTTPRKKSCCERRRWLTDERRRLRCDAMRLPGPSPPSITQQPEYCPLGESCLRLHYGSVVPLVLAGGHHLCTYCSFDRSICAFISPLGQVFSTRPD